MNTATDSLELMEPAQKNLHLDVARPVDSFGHGAEQTHKALEKESSPQRLQASPFKHSLRFTICSPRSARVDRSNCVSKAVISFARPCSKEASRKKKVRTGGSADDCNPRTTSPDVRLRPLLKAVASWTWGVSTRKSRSPPPANAGLSRASGGARTHRGSPRRERARTPIEGRAASASPRVRSCIV